MCRSPCDLDAVALFADDVHLVRWPAEEPRRLTSKRRATVRSSSSAGTRRPPEDWDELEDWIRLPLDPDELRPAPARCRHRARRVARPVVDDGGLLRVGDQWVDLAVGRAVAEVLVGRFGEVVPAEEHRGGTSRTAGARRTPRARR